MCNRAKRKTALLQDITFLSFSIEYSFLILFALFFSRVQGCVDCNAVRRARGKLVFFPEKHSRRRHLEFFHEKTHHRTPQKKLPSRKKAMRGSTGYLDMNKKPCHPSQNNKIFFSLARSIFLLRRWRSAW